MSDLVFGLWITLAGMGAVFALLALLWALLSLAGMVERRQPAEPREQARLHVTAPAGAPEISEEDLAAITVAVIAHRSLRRRQAAPEMRSVVPGSQLWASRWLGAGRTRQTRGWQGRR